MSEQSKKENRGASLPILVLGIILLTYAGFAASHFFVGQWYCTPTVITIIFAIVLHALMALNTILLNIKYSMMEKSKHERLIQKNCR